MKAVTLKQAIEIAKRLDVDISFRDGRTFYATNEQETDIYEFDSRKDRDYAVLRWRNKNV